MSRIALRFPRKAKLALYSLTLLSLSSGLGFYILNRWFQVEGDFGPEKHPWQATVLKIHGASAFLTLIGFGYLLASHIHVGWRSRRNRVLGITLVGTIIAQILTGYGLYYASTEQREVLATLHLYSGLSFPLVLIAHIIMARRTRPQPALRH